MALPTLDQLLASLCLALASCAMPLGDPVESWPVNDPADQEQILVRNLRGGVPLEFVPALQAIEVALADGANDTARGALRALYSRGLEGTVLELAQAFERILDGRDCVASLDLRLEAVEDPEAQAVYRLDLVIAQNGPRDLVYRPGGVRLWVYQYAVAPDGTGQRGSRRDAVPFPVEIKIPREGETRYEVARLSLDPPAGILAFSSSLRLELMPGEFREEGGRYLPAQSVPQPKLELVRLAGALPNSAIEPRELVSYVAAGKLYLPALMERAVRIDPARREETLDLLAPTIAGLNVVDMRLLVAPLRWLSRTADPGGDPEAWRRYMARRSEHRAANEPTRSGGLVLPDS